MRFFVASTGTFIEVDAPDEQQALKQGIQHFGGPKCCGNLSAVKKPESLAEARESLRRLNISYGEEFEYNGYPPYDTGVLITAVETMMASL